MKTKIVAKTKLQKYDQVSLQSLASGLAGEPAFAHRFTIGKQRVAMFDLIPVVSPHALDGISHLSHHPEVRAADLMAAMIDSNIKLVIANIGGFDSNRLIPYLDRDQIQNHPKPILGYSDITSLHLYFYMLGIQTYYGPTILDGWAENHAMHKLTLTSLKTVLLTNQPQAITSAPAWTSEYLEWQNPTLDQVKRTMVKETHGHLWNNFPQKVTGHLLGGCLDTIITIKHQPFFPPESQWKGAVIFLETSEQKMTPAQFEAGLLMLDQEIAQCHAVIFGKPKDEQFFEQYWQIIKRVIKKPVVYNLNFGHTAPFYTLPYGGIMTLDPFTKKITITK